MKKFLQKIAKETKSAVAAVSDGRPFATFASFCEKKWLRLYGIRSE